MGAAFLLPRIVGHGRASELLFFGDIVPTPKEAYAMGLVNQVVPDVECLPLAMPAGPSASRAARRSPTPSRSRCWSPSTP
jgi:enoyl-CoA hydratase/carnithine racemase